MTLTRAALPTARDRLVWPLLALAWIAILAALTAWTAMTPTSILKRQLVQLQPWWLDACAAAAAILTFSAWRPLARRIARVDRLALVVVVAIALAVTLGVPPRTNRIFYDEQIYQSIGRNLADLRLAQMCNDGSIERGRLRCAAGEYNKQPYAYPHLLSLAYRAFGVREDIAFGINAAASALAACLVYATVILLFGDRVAAFAAALLLALAPEQVIWAATAAAEPTASCAIAAAVLATACFVRSRQTVALYATAALSAYAVQFRPESILVVPVMLLLTWQRAREELTSPRFWAAGLLFLVLTAIHFGHLSAVRTEGWGTTGDRLSVAYVPANLRVNGWFYLWDPRFPAAWTALAVVGLFAGRAPNRAGRAALALQFCLFFGVALLFYAGSYDYGADVRYSLATYPPLAMLGGLGIAGALAFTGRFWPGLPRMTAALVLVGVMFCAHLRVVRELHDGAWASRADVTFARWLVPRLSGGYVFTHNPGMFHVWGVSAGQMSLATTNPRRAQELAQVLAGRTYVHWNFWCNVDDVVQRAFCTTALARFPGEVVEERRVGSQRFALYRVHGPARQPHVEPQVLP